jgi:hypothetical protein
LKCQDTDANTIQVQGDGTTGILTLGGQTNGTQTVINDSTETITAKADGGIAQSAPASTTAGILANGQISFYLDQVGNALKIAVKYSDGTTKTGSIVLI